MTKEWEDYWRKHHKVGTCIVDEGEDEEVGVEDTPAPTPKVSSRRNLWCTLLVRVDKWLDRRIERKMKEG